MPIEIMDIDATEVAEAPSGAPVTPRSAAHGESLRRLQRALRRSRSEMARRMAD